MNPDKMPQGAEMGPEAEREKAKKELDLLNQELIADAAYPLGDDAVAAKLARREELERIIAEQAQS